MSMLRVRVDMINDKVYDQLISWLDKYGDRYLVVKHEPVSENRHYHAWIASKFKEVTLRMSIKKYIPDLEGNKDYAIQKCDVERYEEYLTYMFNRRGGNKSTFMCHKELSDWQTYEEKSIQLTEDYYKSKGVKTKNDIINILLSSGNEYETPNDIFDEVMAISKNNSIVLSINAIREIIVYVGYNAGSRNCRGTVRQSVLKIFS